MNQANASSLAAVYTKRGMPCEIEASTTGVVVYASKPEHAGRIALDIARAARARDPRATSTTPAEDKDENEATRWWAAVDFDWRRF